MTSRQTNWHDNWLNYLRCLANSLLSRTGLHGYWDQDDLVNRAWLRLVRRQDPKIPINTFSRRVRHAMYQEIPHQRAGRQPHWTDEQARTLAMEDLSLDLVDAQDELDHMPPRTRPDPPAAPHGGEEIGRG